MAMPRSMSRVNSAWSEFTRLMLRGIAMGTNASYATLSGDLRDVNFSSLRQGVLDERDGWRVLQAFAIGHFCRPLFRAWLPMAITTGACRVPLPPAENPDFYFD